MPVAELTERVDFPARDDLGWLKFINFSYDWPSDAFNLTEHSVR